MKKRDYNFVGNCFFAVIFLLSGFTAIGQNNQARTELYSFEAQQAVPGASMVVLNGNSTVPGLVMFQEGSQKSITDFFLWLRKTYNLPATYDFVLRKESANDVGAILLKYDVMYRGVLVDQNWMNVHVKNSLVYQFNSNIHIVTGMPTTPGLAETEALQQALNQTKAKGYLWQNPKEEEMLKARENNPNATYYPTGTLVIVQTEGNAFVLAWRFDIYTEEIELAQQIFIEASTGAKLKSYPLFYNCNAGTVASTWYGTQNINTDKNGDDNFILLDDCGGAQIRTTQTDGSDFVAADNNWTSAGETGPGTTHLHGRITMDYFSAVHSRDSYDDAGGNLEIRYIDESNAYSGGGGLIRVGNSNSALDAEHYNTLDVVAHEFTHSVTANEANLVYQGEPGALNESFSDIFGETCEMWYEGLPSNQWDWLHREDYYTGENRSFIDPKDKSDPDTYQGDNWASTCNACGDNGGVHTNSGVMNYWFYLLTVGGSGTNDNGDDYTVSGIGLSKARTLSWDNLTAQLGVNSDYSDARAGAIAAAIARYGACSNEVKQVTNAWYAVGVGNAYVDVSLWFKQNVTCAGDADGNVGVNVEGTPPFTYSWSDGPANTGSRYNLPGGNYTVTVTDATGCSASLNVTINEPDVLTISIINESDYNGYNVTCNGAADGIAQSAAQGGTPPYSYLWDDPQAQTTASADDLPAGNYNVTVTDDNGCMASTSVNISEPPVLTAVISDVSDYNGYNISCNGGSDGWAQVTTGGGVAPYTYEWSDGQTTATASNLSAGYYEVTVTDANGCTETDNVTLTEPTPLTIDAGPNQTVYFGYPPAECANIAWSGAGGGVAPYTITWSDNGAQMHQVCPGNTTTVYTVTIEDANGCIETDEVTICVIDVRCGKKLDKVEMCHVPDGNPGNSHTICVAVNAVATHLAHGDMLAACGTDHSCEDGAKTAPAPTVYANEIMLDAYPNPFKESATITFASGVEGNISVELFDNVGRLIKVIYAGPAELGMQYTFTIQAHEVGTGLNLCVLRHADGTTIVKKLIADK